MHVRMISRLFFISALIVVFGACAKISSPSGGLRDKLPPVVVKTIPLNGAKNFRGNKIEILFNEYVVLDNISDKFMVSPPMKKKPRVLIRGKGVVVEFDDKLKDSTTYTFYFQDAIKDLNEGNVLKNYQFVLSTGPVIDSLSVTGNIYNAYNLEVPEKTIVLLYRELADSAVVKHLPDYISRVDQNGYFRINNVRPGKYRLYGLKDDDNSKNYNLPNEEFAFMDSAIVITPEKNFIPPPVVKDSTAVKKVINKIGTSVKDSTTVKKVVDKNTAGIKDTTSLKKGITEPPALIGEYRLYQFTAARKAHYLISSKRDIKYKMVYILSLPPDTMKFEFSIPGTDSKAFFTETSRNRDTLRVWLADSSLYSKQEISTIVKFPFTDTLGITGYKQDTIVMRFLTPRAPKTTKISRNKRTVFKFESNISSGSIKPGQTIYFKSGTPFRQPDTSRIRLYELVQTTKKNIPYQIIRDSSNSCIYYLKTKLAEEKKYLFIADSASFGNIYGEYSDSLGIKLSVKDPESYNKLTLDLRNYDGARIIQLLDINEKLVAEAYMKKDGKVVFPLLENGVYRVRVIYDLNGDGKWTTGDFTKQRQPEPVSYYQKELEMKQNWEVEQPPWDISIIHFKDPKFLEKKKGK
jgi:hypothetical protein